MRAGRLAFGAAALAVPLGAALVVAHLPKADAPPRREGPVRATPGSSAPVARVAVDPVAAPDPLPPARPSRDVREARPPLYDPTSPQLAAQVWPGGAPAGIAPSPAVAPPGRAAPGTAARAAPEAAPRAVPAALTDGPVPRGLLDDLLAAETPDDGGRPPPFAGPPIPAVLARFTPLRVAQLLGRPSLVRQEGPAEYWQYRTRDCVLGVHFHALGTIQLVSHVDARGRRDRPGHPGETTPGDCLAELVAARPRS